VCKLRGYHFSALRALSLEQGSPTIDHPLELPGKRQSGYKVTTHADGTKVIEKNLKGGGTIQVTKTPGQKLDMTTVIYPDEGKYVGQWRHNEKNGFGTHTYSFGGSYKGEYKNGREHGEGVKTHADGSIIQGEFKHGKIHNGRGILVIGEKRRLEGEWTDGKLDGFGRVETKDGIVFEWTMKEGLQTGFGSQRFPDGTLYEGHWIDMKTLGLARFTEMKRHGAGRLTTPRKQVLQGVWEKGTFLEGHGTMVLPQGEILEGTWAGGKMEGPGKFFSPRQGVSYVGDFHHGLKHGLGILNFKNGAKYVGEFVNGHKHGQGKYTNRAGEVLEGLWKDDEFCGAPVSSAETGEVNAADAAPAQEPKTSEGKYEGELVDGKPHGHGTYTSDTMSYVGMWHKGKRGGLGKETTLHGTAEGEFRFDKLYNGSGVMLVRNEVCEGTWVKGLMQGHGVKKSLHHRSHYCGELRNGRMHGQGMMAFSNGTTYGGAFEADKQHGVGRLVDTNGIVLYWGDWRMNRRHGHGLAHISIFKNSELPKRLRGGRGAREAGKHEEADEDRIEGVWENGRFLGEEPLPDRLRADLSTFTATTEPAELVRKEEEKNEEMKNLNEAPVEAPHEGLSKLRKAKDPEDPKNPREEKVEKTEKEEGKVMSVKTGSAASTEVTLKYPDGSHYKGAVIEGMRHGNGVLTSADGLTTYTGEWKKNKRRGQGTTTCPKGQCTGEYRNDQIFCGAGLIVLPNGEVHEGHWEQGLLEGYGVRSEPRRKAVYSGHFERGRRHGQGVLTILNGDTYTGAFERGFRHGLGVCVGADGRTYTGEWVKGCRHGMGRLTTDRGWTEGEFRDDKIYNGTGEVFAAKLGVTIKRVWVEGALQQEEPKLE